MRRQRGRACHPAARWVGRRAGCSADSGTSVIAVKATTVRDRRMTGRRQQGSWWMLRHAGSVPEWPPRNRPPSTRFEACGWHRRRARSLARTILTVEQYRSPRVAQVPPNVISKHQRHTHGLSLWPIGRIQSPFTPRQLRSRRDRLLHGVGIGAIDLSAGVCPMSAHGLE